MQRLLGALVILLWGSAVFDAAAAATGKVIKVLPHYLDLEGRHSLSPSLYDRDAYQAHLRKNPAERSGIRFDIQWRAQKTANLKLRAELRGMKNDRPQTKVLETPLPKASAISRWEKLTLGGEAYQEFGELSAWRVTLWDGDTLLGEQTSFLWQGEKTAKSNN